MSRLLDYKKVLKEAFKFSKVGRLGAEGVWGERKEGKETRGKSLLMGEESAVRVCKSCRLSQKIQFLL